MSNRKSANALIRQRYDTGRRVIRKNEGRELTQREFLDVAFGNNPKTGKPYNTRTLRKWLNNERNAQAAVEHSTRDTYSFQQRVTIEGNDYGPVLIKPSGRSGLDLFTPSGRQRVKRATRARMEQLAFESRQTETAYRKTSRGKREEYRPVRTVRGMKLSKARAVQHARTGTIITRRAPRNLRYVA